MTFSPIVFVENLNSVFEYMEMNSDQMVLCKTQKSRGFSVEKPTKILWVLVGLPNCNILYIFI